MFYRPDTFAAALRLKADHAAAIKPISGGTDLVVGLNRGQSLGVDVLDLTAAKDYRRIDHADGSLILSGGTTFAQLEQLDIACLARAAASVGGPQIRNRGTIAGNLATASPAGDGSVALLALDAEVELAHADRGTRWLRLIDYFEDYRQTALGDDELISHVRIPTPSALQASAWYKIGKRGAVNISLVCAAAARFLDGRICLAFGSVAPIPMRAVQTEKLLQGQPLTGALLHQAAQAASAEVKPIDDWRASADYRKAMCAVLARRVLEQLQTDDERQMP